MKLEGGTEPNEHRRVQLYYATNELTQDWHYVCVKWDSAEQISDSVCRQLGFTNAIMPKAPPVDDPNR